MRRDAPPNTHDTETDLYTALKAWDMAGRTTVPYPPVEQHLANLPDGWTPPPDWHATYEGEPDTAEVLAAYVRAREAST